jgi:serine/threonine-protein kinase RsbW
MQSGLSEDHCFHLDLGSRFENIELVQVVLDESLRSLECDDDTRYWVGIAVREAVANAIKHGNRQDAEKRVDVELTFDHGYVDIVVSDQGSGFEPEKVRDPLAPENLFKTNGRGIFYMKRFMDDVNYSARPGGGTIVTLRKRIAAPAPADAAAEPAIAGAAESSSDGTNEPNNQKLQEG